MSAFSDMDAIVVKAACETLGIGFYGHVTMGDKLRLKDYTGLSLSLVARALTNIRKGIK